MILTTLEWETRYYTHMRTTGSQYASRPSTKHDSPLNGPAMRSPRTRNERLVLNGGRSRDLRGTADKLDKVAGDGINSHPFHGATIHLLRSGGNERQAAIH